MTETRQDRNFTTKDTPMTLFSCPPSVYIVDGEYQICVLVESECTMWVEIAGRKFYDHSNGILRSGRFVHIAHVPQDLLDQERAYTVRLQKLNERKPYFTDYGEIESKEYTFRPIEEKEECHILNLADAHSLVEEPIGSGSYFGDELDLLLLNGDIPNHSGDIDYFKSIYQISGHITGGRVPCVFSRGNHDMRGIYAERLAEFTPTANGKSYFTFRAGPIWGIVLDVAEDKSDMSEEYGRTICCSAFREEEERFLDAVIEQGAFRDAPVRLVVSHAPFAFKLPPPFDIEETRYRSWCAKLQAVRPTVMLTGHLHECFLETSGGQHDTYGQPCPVVCSSHVKMDDPKSHTAGAVFLRKDGVKVRFVRFSEGKNEVIGEESCAF